MSHSKPNPSHYLAGCEIIDIHTPSIRESADRLRGSNDIETARNCFEFVRDEIAHSSDYERNPVTCVASDVLKHGTGYCYAKSHLLCALLRASGIPAGLCYQRLSVDGVGPPFCLHGLCAVYLKDFGWYRIDPRGNREDVDAQFTPPQEQLAFSMELEGERDYVSIYRTPHESIVECLREYDDWREVYENLPDVDIEPVGMNAYRSQAGTVVEHLKPLTFKVRLESGEVILCGLARSYFGRMLPNQAIKRINKTGPHVGDLVSLRLTQEKSQGMRRGIILRS